MKRMTALLVAIALLGLPAAARAPQSDPLQPQLSIRPLFPPSPLVQHGVTKLVYELETTNYVSVPYTIESVTAHAGEKTETFSGPLLGSMMRKLGVHGPETTLPSRSIAPGATAIVYLVLSVRAHAIPDRISHTFTVRSADGKRHLVEPPDVPVSATPATVVAPPLRGAWIAGDSMHNSPDAAHRRTIQSLNGEPSLAQRYAIDFVQVRNVGGALRTYRGPIAKNASYFCWNAPVYSVAAGTVVEAVDGLPENVPQQPPVISINLANAGGNHVVIRIAPNRYAFYAHMRPGSLRVKTGDEVAAGEIIGHVGNTGSSSEPHLHFHIVDQPSFLGGQGVPYAFDAFDASMANAIVAAPNDAGMAISAPSPLRPFRDDYPAPQAAVTFK